MTFCFNSCYQYKINEIVNKCLSAGDKGSCIKSMSNQQLADDFYKPIIKKK